MSEINPTPEDVEAARQLANKLAIDRRLRIGSDIETLSHAMAQFRAEVRQASAADTARLNWLDSLVQQPHYWITFQVHNSADMGYTENFITFKVPQLYGTPGYVGKGNSLRDAIDAARNGVEQTGGVGDERD